MFVAYDISIQLISELARVAPTIRMHDPDLAKQLTRAATSIPLNLAEGRRRVGKDRLHHFRIADGSAGEVEAALDVAVAWGYLEVAPRETVKRLLRLLWGLTHS